MMYKLLLFFALLSSADAFSQARQIIIGTPTTLSGQVSADSVIATKATSSAINIKDFGAIGDGIADDRAAIQRALDSGYTQKKVVHMPSGTYSMSTSSAEGIISNLFVKPGVVLIGDGESTILRRKSTSLNGYTIEYYKSINDAAVLRARNYTFKNFRIVGTTGRGYEAPGATDSDGGIFLGTAANRMNKVLIEGVRADTLNKECFAVWDAVECIMRNNKVYSCNHDAYNPQIIERLIMQGNIAEGANFAIEYDGRRADTTKTTAFIVGNSFTNCYEYGINIESGDDVKISNNIISGQEGSTTVTGQSIGVFIHPSVAAIDKVEITDNTINNFINGQVDNSNATTGDYIVNNVIIKGNTFSNSGQSAIRLIPFSTAKILHTQISGNTIYNWNRIDNNNSIYFSAVQLGTINDVSVFGNRIYNVTNGRRNDPLYLNNTTNIHFFNNDCQGPPSQYYGQLEVKKQGTNAGYLEYNNIGLYSSSTLGIPVEMVVAVSDEPTTITTGTSKLTFRMPYAMRLLSVRASVNTASTSGLPTIDVKQNGTSVLSTLVTINANEKTSTTATTPPVISGTSANNRSTIGLTDDAEMTVDITVAGTGAKGLKIYLIGYK